ncbi:hypothetical protein Tco_1316320 [Tanacetum coccineum]
MKKFMLLRLDASNARDPITPKIDHKKEKGKPLEEAYYTQFGGPFQGGRYRATAPRYYQRNNANPSFQERRQSMEDTLRKFMSESAKRNKENTNLIKEIRASTDAAIRNQGASIKTLEIQIGQMSKSRQMTVPFRSRLDNHYCEEEGNYGPKFMEAFGALHVNNDIPRKEKDPGIFGGYGNDLSEKEMGMLYWEPFLREVGIRTKRFKGIITLYNGDDEVTYQIVQSHPRFKHHTNEQCKKIPPLLKISEKDERNGISHAYKKLKGFYKGVLKLGPDFIRVRSWKEWAHNAVTLPCMSFGIKDLVNEILMNIGGEFTNLEDHEVLES